MESIRKIIFTLTVFLTMLVCSLFGVQIVIAQYTADGQGFPLASPITIISPSNTTYSNNELTLIVTFKFLLSPKYSNLSYSMDGKNKVTIPLTWTHEPREVTRTYANGTSVVVNSTLMVPYNITGKVALPELFEGQHNITVYARYLFNQIVAFDESTVYFTICSDLEQHIPEFPLESYSLFGEKTFHIHDEHDFYTVRIYSNSTISEFFFHYASKKISFNINGTIGTTGVCNITIPSELMSPEFSICKDGTPLIKNTDYFEAFNGNHYLFAITYKHSTHMIEIIATNDIPEFPSWIIIPLFFVTTVSVLVFKKRLFNQLT